jgi:hypothetical protein
MPPRRRPKTDRKGEHRPKDLQKAFSEIEGFSKRNMFKMRAFYKAYEKVPQAVAQLDDLPIFSIPWGHNALILEKGKNTIDRNASAADENGIDPVFLSVPIFSWFISWITSRFRCSF